MGTLDTHINGNGLRVITVNLAESHSAAQRYRNTSIPPHSSTLNNDLSFAL